MFVDKFSTIRDVFILFSASYQDYLNNIIIWYFPREKAFKCSLNTVKRGEKEKMSINSYDELASIAWEKLRIRMPPIEELRTDNSLDGRE